MISWLHGRNFMAKWYHGAKLLIHGSWETEQEQQHEKGSVLELLSILAPRSCLHGLLRYTRIPYRYTRRVLQASQVDLMKLMCLEVLSVSWESSLGWVINAGVGLSDTHTLCVSQPDTHQPSCPGCWYYTVSPGTICGSRGAFIATDWVFFHLMTAFCFHWALFWRIELTVDGKSFKFRNTNLLSSATVDIICNWTWLALSLLTSFNWIVITCE